MKSGSKIEEIKAILHGSEIAEMRELLDSLSTSRELYDTNLNRIIKDYQTRLTLLEQKTSEIKEMIMEKL